MSANFATHIESGDAESLRKAAAHFAAQALPEQRRLISEVSSVAVQVLFRHLEEQAPVQETARRGYVLADDSSAQLAQAMLTGYEAEWTSRLETLNWPFTRRLLLDLLQSQSTERHARAVWLLTQLAPYFSDVEPIEVLFLNNGPCADLGFLDSLPQLRWLILDHLEAANLEPLKGLTSLERLSLRGSPAADFSALASLPVLSSLVLDAARQLNDLGPIAQLASLTELDLRETGVVHFDDLSGLKALTRLRVGRAGFPLDLSTIPSLDALSQLDIVGSSVAGLDRLTRFSNLRQLRITGAQGLESGDVEALDTLEVLCLNDCDLEHLDVSHFSSLRELDVIGTPVALNGALGEAITVIAGNTFGQLEGCFPNAEQRSREANRAYYEGRGPLSVVSSDGFPQG